MRAVAWIALAGLLALGLLLLLVARSDLAWAKGPVEALVRAETGRSFAIGGLSLRLGWRTTLSLEDVRLGNASWSEAGDMAHVERLRIVVDTASLLRGPILIEALDLEGGSVLLERTASERNWVFGEAPEPAEETSPEGLPVVLRDARVRDLRVRYTGPALDRPLDLHVASMQQYQTADDLLDVEVEGTLNEAGLRANAIAGPIANLLRGEDVVYSGEVTWGETHLVAAGQVDRLAAPARPRLSVRLDAPDAGRVTDVLGVRRLGAGAIDLDLELAPVPEGVQATARAHFGGFDLSAEGRASDLSTLSEFSLELHADGPELDVIGDLASLPGLPADPFRVSGSARRVGDELSLENLAFLVGEASLRAEWTTRLPHLEDTRLELALHVPDAKRFRGALGPARNLEGTVDVHADLRPVEGGTEIRELVIEAAGSKLEIVGTLGDYPGFENSQLELHGAGDDLHSTGLALGIRQRLPSGPFDWNAEIVRAAASPEVRALELRVAGSTLGAQGTIGDSPDLSGTVLAIEASGTNPGSLHPALAPLDLPEGPYRASGQLRLSPEAVVLRDLAVDLEAAQARIDLRIERAGPPYPVHFEIDANGRSLAELAPPLGAYTPPAAPFELRARGTKRAERWLLQDVELDTAGASLALDGRFEAGARRLSGTVRARAPSLKALGEIADGELPDVSLELTGQLLADREQVTLEKLTATLGESDLAGTVRVRAGKPARMELDLRSKRLWLVDDAQDAEPEPPPSPDGRAIPDAHVPLEALRRNDVELRLRADTVVLGEADLRNLDLEASIEAGRLTVRRFQVEGPHGVVNSSFAIVPPGPGRRRAGRATLSADVKVDGLVLDVRATPDGESELLPRMDAHIQFVGTGRTLREVAASLNGDVTMSGGEATLSNALLGGLFTDFVGELLTTVNPLITRDPSTRLVCSAVLFDIEDGVIVADPGVVVQTDKLNVFASGTVDLRTERIDLVFWTEARETLSVTMAEFINPFVKVGGTLASPRIEIDRQSAAITGGAAVLTGGLTLLGRGLWQRLTREENPCEHALTQRD